MKKLTMFEKNKIITRLEIRQHRWSLVKNYELKNSESILLVGDRPGPSAPKEKHYHHTPFYSLKHCSGWLNCLLEEENIPENKLIWINSANENGKYYDFKIVESVKPSITIALGEKANSWLIKNGLQPIKVSHPQFWKRFKNKEPYPLIELIKSNLP